MVLSLGLKAELVVFEASGQIDSVTNDSTNKYLGSSFTVTTIYDTSIPNQEFDESEGYYTGVIKSSFLTIGEDKYALTPANYLEPTYVRTYQGSYFKQEMGMRLLGESEVAIGGYEVLLGGGSIELKINLEDLDGVFPLSSDIPSNVSLVDYENAEVDISYYVDGSQVLVGGTLSTLVTREYVHCLKASGISFTEWQPHALFKSYGTVTHLETSVAGVCLKVFRSTDLEVWTDITNVDDQYVYDTDVELILESGSTFTSNNSYTWPKWENAYYIVQPCFYPDPEGTR